MQLRVNICMAMAISVSVGNTVKVIEPNPARWKKFTLDADGNITQVEEPGALLTSYEYTEFGKLKKAIMTRNGVTQTRTWTYDPATLRRDSIQTTAYRTTRVMVRTATVHLIVWPLPEGSTASRHHPVRMVGTQPPLSLAISR